MNVAATALTPGQASGALLVLDAPLSLWGGIDIHTGTIIDHSHPQLGAIIAGRILAMPSGRGSSSSSSALVEAARLGHAPCAIVLTQADPILTIGALVAAELYGLKLPIVVVGPSAWPDLRAASHAEIDTTSDCILTLTARDSGY